MERFRSALRHSPPPNDSGAPPSHRAPRALTAVATGLAAALALSACSGSADSDPGHMELRIADSFALTHPIGRSGTTDFMEILNEKGPDVGFEVEYFDSGQLSKQRDMPAVLRTGVAQIGAVSPAYVGTQLPLSNVGDLPGFTQDSCVGADAVLEIMQPGTTLFETELAPQDLRPLWVAFLPGYEAMSAAFPVESVDALHGKIMRSTGGAADRVVDAAGAAGVSMPLGDLYEALSRRTVEGTLASPLSITPYSLEEVIEYSTDGANLGSFTATYSVSNSAWAAMTPEQQELLMEASTVAQHSVCNEINRTMDESKQAMRDAGVQMFEISDADRPEWEALAAPVRESWVTDLESINLPAQKVLDDFTAALARAEAEHGSERS